MGIPEWSRKNGIDAAIAYCLEEIQFYEDEGRSNNRRWVIWQYVVISFGSLATLVAAVPNIPDKFSMLRGLPAAIATIAAAVLGVYNYKAETIRKGATHDALRGELIRFVSSAEPYGKEEKANIALFVSRIRSIIQGELQAWRSVFTDSTGASSESPVAGARAAPGLLPAAAPTAAPEAAPNTPPP